MFGLRLLQRIAWFRQSLPAFSASIKKRAKAGSAPAQGGTGFAFENAFSFFTIYFLRLDRVYYGNRLSDTQDIMDLTPLVKDVATPIDQRSTPGEQIKSKSRQAKDVIIKWANNPNLNEYLLTKMKDEKAQ